MTRLRGRGLSLFATTCALLTACSSSDPPAPTSVAISLPVTTILVGETHQASVVVLDQRGEPIQVSDAPVWRASPARLVSISAGGAVTGLEPGEIELVASVVGLTDAVLVRIAEPFGLELSLTTSGAPGAPGIWDCAYTSRIAAVGGREEDLATVTRVLFEARTESGAVDETEIPPEAIRDPEIKRGGSKTFSGVDRSAATDPTDSLSVLVEYVQQGQNLSLRAIGAC